MHDYTGILACPLTGQALRRSEDGASLVTVDGSRTYPLTDGVARLLPGDARDKEVVQQFYEEEGWAQDDEGVFGDTKAFVDTRPGPLAFTRQCMQRLNAHFGRGGAYILDAGSGPIAHDEYLEYDAHFERRVCVDLSAAALKVARTKLGDRGIYLQGDLTCLPVQTGSVDAVTCNHVIYQIPDPSAQAAAFREVWRVLKPGGVGVVVYWWAQSPLEWRLRRLARLIGRRGHPASEQPHHDGPELVHAPQSLKWFEDQDWPFAYKLEPFRVVTNQFMREHVTDDWRGRLFLRGLFALQRLAPTACAKYGTIPAIVVYKD